MHKAFKTLLVILTSCLTSSLAYAQFEGTIIDIYSSNVVIIKKTDGQVVNVKLMDAESQLAIYRDRVPNKDKLEILELEAKATLRGFVHRTVTVLYETPISSHCYTGLVLDKEYNKPIGVLLIGLGLGEHFPIGIIYNQWQSLKRAITNCRGAFDLLAGSTEEQKKLLQSFEESYKGILNP